MSFAQLLFGILCWTQEEKLRVLHVTLFRESTSRKLHDSYFKSEVIWKCFWGRGIAFGHFVSNLAELIQKKMQF